MKKRPPLAILQVIPKHHGLLPVGLVKALAILDKMDYPYQFYDIERSVRGADFRTSLLELFASIKEETVLVSMACHNNYPKIDSLIFIYLYLAKLKDKKIIICSPYFSLYETGLIHRDNVVFSPLEIEDFILRNIGDPGSLGDHFLTHLESLMTRYGYQGYRFWAYLTFGCYASCSFCYNRLPFQGAPRISKHSPDNVLQWMGIAKQIGENYFEFCEPNFIANRPFTESFLNRLKQENLGVKWRCKTRLDDMDAHVYDLMTAAGCQTIFFGFEHVDPVLLRRIHKRENSSKKLADFLKYRKKETKIELSFLMGIRDETPSQLHRNLEMVLQVGSVHGVEPNIGWQLLFNRHNRSKVVPNYIIPFMYIMNSLPEGMGIDGLLMRDLLRICKQEPFFDFWCMTESDQSLQLMQHLIAFLKSRPDQQVIKDYNRLLNYEGGELVRVILKSRTLDELNDKVLSMVGA